MRQILAKFPWLIFLSLVAGVAIVIAIREPTISPITLGFQSIATVIGIYIAAFFGDLLWSAFRRDRSQIEIEAELEQEDDLTIGRLLLIFGLIALSVLLATA